MKILFKVFFLNIILSITFCSWSFINFNKDLTIQKAINQDENEKNPVLFENDIAVFTVSYATVQTPNTSTIKNYALITILNKSAEHITISYNKEAYYDGICSSCQQQESQFELGLEPHEAKNGILDNNSNGLRIFHSFKTGESKRKLTDLKISNVIIKNL